MSIERREVQLHLGEEERADQTWSSSLPGTVKQKETLILTPVWDRRPTLFASMMTSPTSLAAKHTLYHPPPRQLTVLRCDHEPDNRDTALGVSLPNRNLERPGHFIDAGDQLAVVTTLTKERFGMSLLEVPRTDFRRGNLRRNG